MPLPHIPKPSRLLTTLALVAFAAATAWAGDDAVSQRMKKDLFFLASDECEGRGIDTKGINRAADYIVGELKQAGLRPGGKDGSWFQPFSVNQGDGAVKGVNTLTLRGPGQDHRAEDRKRLQGAAAFGLRQRHRASRVRGLRIDRAVCQLRRFQRPRRRRQDRRCLAACAALGRQGCSFRRRQGGLRRLREKDRHQRAQPGRRGHSRQRPQRSGRGRQVHGRQGRPGRQCSRRATRAQPA